MTEIVKVESKVDTLKAWFGTPETRRALDRLARKHIDPVKLLQMAVRCVERVPSLADCTPASVVGCIMEASTLGLELGMAGGAWLVPFKDHGVKKCQLIPDYRGLMKLARRSGEIESLEAHVVYEADHFEYSLGLERNLTHRPAGKDRGVGVFAYALCRFRKGGYQFEVMSAESIEAIRERAPSGNSPAWRDNPAEMYRKTVMRRLCKFLPFDHEDNALQRAVALDEQHDAGLTQDIDIVGVQAGGSQPALPATVDDIPPPFDPEKVDAPEPAKAEPKKATTTKVTKPRAASLKIIDDARKSLGDRFGKILSLLDIDESALENDVTQVELDKLVERLLQEVSLAATQAAKAPTDGAEATA